VVDRKSSVFSIPMTSHRTAGDQEAAGYAVREIGSLENFYCQGSRFARRIEFVRRIFLKENTDQFVGSDGNDQNTARHADYKSPAEKVGHNADQ
jgi:hypothetical protein